MAWPSSTKAGTTNVDNGSDKPSLARPDIKQNIDNVNAIIDTFNISSPNDGDLLQYSTSTGQWEQVASSSVGTDLSMVFLQTGTGKDASNRLELTEYLDTNGIATTGSYTFTLPSGSYYINVDSTTSTTSVQDSITLYNETTTSDIYNFNVYSIGASLRAEGYTNFTLSGTSSLSFKVNNYNNIKVVFKIIKTS